MTRRRVQHVDGVGVTVAVTLLALTLGPAATPAVGPPVPVVVDASWHRWELREANDLGRGDSRRVNRLGVGMLEDDADDRARNHHGAHAAPVLQLRVKLMNITEDPVGGTVVIRLTLRDDGLEEDYLEATTRLYGAETLQETLAERRHQSARSRAILNYLERGGDLPEGKTYEPVEGTGQRHVMRWRIPLRLRAGDTVQYQYERIVPRDQGGHRLEIEVETIEVGA